MSSKLFLALTILILVFCCSSPVSAQIKPIKPVPANSVSKTPVKIFLFPNATNRSEYQITFESKPEISSITLGNRQSALVITDDYFLEAEYVPTKPNQAIVFLNLSENDFWSIALEMAKVSNLTKPQINVGRNDLGRYFVISGTKMVDDYSTSFEIRSYYGQSGRFRVTTGTKVKENSTTLPIISRFLTSLMRNLK